MSYTNCYNGCTETVSDNCVRYTGVDYEALGVATGDNLISVEQAIMNALVPLLTGVGDDITLSAGDVCALITGYLTAGLTHTSKEWITALSKGECNLQAQIVVINNTLAILNADYSIGCLTGVTASSDTHAILQAVITKLCTVASDLVAFETQVNSTYVKLADLNALIAAYLSEQTGSTQQYTKMVPYTAVEYYGPLTNFDGTGAGLVNLGWDKIYLCNGANGTPDKRGRVGVGAILTPGIVGPALDAEVNPIYTGNPNYALYSTDGLNTVTLDVTQLPSHTHIPTVTQSTATEGNGLLTDPGHIHYFNYLNKGGGDGSNVFGSENGPSNKATSSAKTGISVTTNVGVNIGNTGSDVGHNNIQPVVATYYIMYIPS
jgi:microcystin-dependent protein